MTGGNSLFKFPRDEDPSVAFVESENNLSLANECVEVAPLDSTTGVRDTKDRTRGHVEIPNSAWAVMVDVLKRP